MEGSRPNILYYSSYNRVNYPFKTIRNIINREYTLKSIIEKIKYKRINWI